MKTLQEAAQLVANQIKNRETERLLCWSAELHTSAIEGHMRKVTNVTLSATIPEDEVYMFIYTQISAAVQIGIAIGIEMEKPTL